MLTHGICPNLKPLCKSCHVWVIATQQITMDVIICTYPISVDVSKRGPGVETNMKNPSKIKLWIRAHQISPDLMCFLKYTRLKIYVENVEVIKLCAKFQHAVTNETDIMVERDFGRFQIEFCFSMDSWYDHLLGTFEVCVKSCKASWLIICEVAKLLITWASIL